MEGSGILLELISRPLLSFVNSFLFKQASKQQLSVQHLTKLCSYKSCYSAFGPVTTVLQWCFCFPQRVTNCHGPTAATKEKTQKVTPPEV